MVQSSSIWFGIALLGQIHNILRVFKRLFTKAPIEGEWFSYHITKRRTEEQLREGKWKFRRNMVNKIKVRVEYSDAKKTYCGNVVSHARDTCINLTGEGFDEFVSIRLLPGWAPGDTIDGVWFGPDENNDLRTDYWFLTKNQLKYEDAIENIEEGRRRVLKTNR